jgi:acyl-CoA reductase-like NAD-dependent aldehyde dehydrogenase
LIYNFHPYTLCCLHYTPTLIYKNVVVNFLQLEYKNYKFIIYISSEYLGGTTMEAKMLINGQHVQASDGATLQSINPCNGEVLGTFPSATKTDVEAALDAAQEGKKKWASMSFNHRAAILLKAAELFEQYEDELANLLCKEIGKPIAMCHGEYREIPSLLRSCVAAGMHQLGQTFPNKKAPGALGDDIAFTIHEPLGVVVCIGPYNFPLSTLTFKTAPALATGNAIIIKAPSDAALSVLRYTEILNEAGFPTGVVQSISGPGSTVGEWLMDTPKINAIGLTGSTRVGQHVMEIASKYFHHVLLELGGNDPLIITEDADLENAAGQSMCRTANAGQICCISKRFLVNNKVKDVYIEKLVRNLKEVKVGDPTDPNTHMGCLVSEKAAIEVEKQIQHTIEQGARLVYGGTRNGAFIEPTVLDCTADMDVAKDMEIFGPVWSVIGFDTDEEAIEIANQSIYGLNGGVIAGTLERGIELASKIEAGTVVANGEGSFRRDIHCFGGYKHSGIGREGILDLMNEYSQRKTIVIKL